jgi:hypothetical protein
MSEFGGTEEKHEIPREGYSICGPRLKPGSSNHLTVTFGKNLHYSTIMNSSNLFSHSEAM